VQCNGWRDVFQQAGVKHRTGRIASLEHMYVIPLSGEILSQAEGPLYTDSPDGREQV
jgi:hypothetical protein